MRNSGRSDRAAWLLAAVAVLLLAGTIDAGKIKKPPNQLLRAGMRASRARSFPRSASLTQALHRRPINRDWGQSDSEAGA